MASTILEQILENIERGATIPLAQAEMEPTGPYTEGTIRALEAQILADLDSELDRLVDELAAASCPSADVRREVGAQLHAVADAHLESFTSAGQEPYDSDNLGSEAALMQGHVPAVGSAVEFEQEGEVSCDPVPVLVAAHGDDEAEHDATESASGPDAPTQSIPREAPPQRRDPGAPVPMTDIQAMIDQLI